MILNCSIPESLSMLDKDWVTYFDTLIDALKEVQKSK